MEMQGKVVVVTGASMGIGEAIAKIFAEQAARVVLMSRDASRAEAARNRIGHSEDTLALACDVRHREEIDRALGLTLHHFNRVDVWINNAGVGMLDTVAEMNMAAARELWDTNLFGTIASMQAVVPVMRAAGGGTIINISSVAGHIPLAFGGVYSASKFGMNAIGKAAGMELRRDNIHLLTVCPGYVATEFGQNMIADRRGSTRPKGIRGIPSARVARAVYAGYRKQKREVIVPWTMHPVVKLYQLFPRVVEWGMMRMMPKAEAGN